MDEGVGGCPTLVCPLPPCPALPAAVGPGGHRSPSDPPHGAASCPPTTAAAGYVPAAAVRSPASACPHHPSAGSGRSGAGCAVCYDPIIYGETQPASNPCQPHFSRPSTSQYSQHPRWETIATRAAALRGGQNLVSAKCQKEPHCL